MAKAKPREKPQSADNYFERIVSAELQELALAARQIIRRTLPGVQECLKWDLPFYMHHGNLCYIQIRKGKVEIGMYRGVYLSNANGLLQGDGKLIKHIILSPDADIPLDAIQEVLLEAVALNQRGPLKLKQP